MSIFGNVRQLGFVSRDIDRSLRFFVDCWGIGPWFVLRNVPSPMLYRGVPIELDVSIGLANCGDLQFEIVTQHDETPSLYLDALTATPGLHVQHFAIWAEDVAQVEAKARSRGWIPEFETNAGSGKSIFLIHPDEPRNCLEISDCNPQKIQVRERIRHAALSWDGTEPIREGLPR